MPYLREQVPSPHLRRAGRVRRPAPECHGHQALPYSATNPTGLYIWVSVCLCVCIFACWSLLLELYAHTGLYTCVPVCMSVCLCVCVSACRSVLLELCAHDIQVSVSVCVSLCLCFRLTVSVCVSLCLLFRLSVSPLSIVCMVACGCLIWFAVSNLLLKGYSLYIYRV